MSNYGSKIQTLAQVIAIFGLIIGIYVFFSSQNGAIYSAMIIVCIPIFYLPMMGFGQLIINTGIIANACSQGQFIEDIRTVAQDVESIKRKLNE